MKRIQDAREKPPRPERFGDVLIRAACPADAEKITALANMYGYRYGTLRLPFQTVEETAKGSNPLIQEQKDWWRNATVRSSATYFWDRCSVDDATQRRSALGCTMISWETASETH